MASINNATRELVCKVVYYGPGMSGKTTNLQIIHGGLPDNNRGQLVSLSTHQERTLFFDFLPVDLGTIEGYKTKFQLYTVPGQVYYNATRKLVLRGVDGVVFVADSQPEKMEENLESLQNLRENLKEYGYDIDTIPHVLQYNKQDIPGALSPRDMDAELNPSGKVPSLGAVAAKNQGVKDTLKIVASGVLDKIRVQMAGTGSTRTVTAAENGGRAVEAAASGAAQAEGSTQSPTATAAVQSPPRRPHLQAKPASEQSAPEQTRLIDPDVVKQRRPQLRRRTPLPNNADKGMSLPKWDFKHECSLWLGRFKVGSGRVRIETRQNLDKQGAYLLTAQWRTLGIFRGSVSTPINPLRAIVPGKPIDLAVIESEDPSLTELVATVDNVSRPSLWVRLRRLALTPVGAGPQDWPDPLNLSSSTSEGARPKDEDAPHVSSDG